MAQLPLLGTLSELATRWKSILDPVLARSFLNGNILAGVQLVSGDNVFNHKLGRQQQGWTITDQNASAEIYRSAAFNDKTLTLHSSATVTVNLWVF